MIFDAALNVESVSAGIAAFFARWPDLGEAPDDGVPPAVREFVRALLAGRAPGEPAASGLLRPTLIVDVAQHVHGERTLAVASFKRFEVRDPVRVASQRYRLTVREKEVLTLLLSGLGASAVAERLGLSQTTVHGYVKQLRRKTRARTLSGMLATLLG